MAFPDGEPPPDAIITRWLALCAAVFKGAPPAAPPPGAKPPPVIAVHCVAGLGRAPVLVAIALIESGMEPLDAVNVIRAKRRGALNARQLAYLENSYKRRASGCAIA
jgi:protein tyrosine phosphatase type 4A